MPKVPKALAIFLCEKLLVSGILEVVVLEVSPRFLDVGEVSTKLHGFDESGYFRHDFRFR